MLSKLKVLETIHRHHHPQHPRPHCHHFSREGHKHIFRPGGVGSHPPPRLPFPLPLTGGLFPRYYHLFRRFPDIEALFLVVLVLIISLSWTLSIDFQNTHVLAFFYLIFFCQNVFLTARKSWLWSNLCFFRIPAPFNLNSDGRPPPPFPFPIHPLSQVTNSHPKTNW